jgi:hypothetical protein
VIDWECTYQVGKRVIIPAEYANKILKIIYKLLKFKVKMENKQTAVDFIFSQLPDEYTTTRQGFEVYTQAKEMEKEQHATTWDKSMDNLDVRGGNIVRAWEDFDEYYNETYGGNK